MDDVNQAEIERLRAVDIVLRRQILEVQGAG